MTDPIPIRVFPRLLVDTTRSGNFDVTLPAATRNPVFIYLDACGVETRIDYILASGATWRPANYYKRAEYQGWLSIYSPQATGFRGVRVSSTGEVHIKIWEVAPRYTVEPVQPGDYILENKIVAAVERETIIDTSGKQQYEIIHESKPGVLAGVGDADPLAYRLIEFEAVQGSVDILVWSPVSVLNYVLGPCTRRLENPASLCVTCWVPLQLAEGERRALLYRGWTNVVVLVNTPGGVLRIREWYPRVEAELVPAG